MAATPRLDEAKDSMGQSKKRTRKSGSRRMKPIQGNRATSANAKKARAKKSSARRHAKG
jgi:hypothetical protein